MCVLALYANEVMGRRGGAASLVAVAAVVAVQVLVWCSPRVAALDSVLAADLHTVCAVAPSGSLHCTGDVSQGFVDSWKGPYAEVGSRVLA